MGTLKNDVLSCNMMARPCHWLRLLKRVFSRSCLIPFRFTNLCVSKQILGVITPQALCTSSRKSPQDKTCIHKEALGLHAGDNPKQFHWKKVHLNYMERRGSQHTNRCIWLQLCRKQFLTRTIHRCLLYHDTVKTSAYIPFFCHYRSRLQRSSLCSWA